MNMICFHNKQSLKPRKDSINTMETPPSISMVKKWFNEFHLGHTSISNADCSGCPKEVINAKMLIIFTEWNRMTEELKYWRWMMLLAPKVRGDISQAYLDIKTLSTQWDPISHS